VLALTRFHAGGFFYDGWGSGPRLSAREKGAN